MLNVYALPVASGAVVAFGGILLLFAAIPTRLIEKTAAWLLSNRKSQSSHL